MEREKFEEIMSADNNLNWSGCNVCNGLDIIRKYLPEGGIEGAEHDIIYSVGVDEILEAGITEEDAKSLRDQNWMINEDGLACFV